MWYRLLFAFLLCANMAYAQGGPGVGPTPGVGFQDEGVTQRRVQILNCTGAGITCSASGITGILNVTGGGGGSANVVSVSINLGTSGGLVFSTIVVGQAWVTGTSVIACGTFATTADGQTVETVSASGVQSIVSNLVAGTGFTLNVMSPRGATGTYRFHCTGA